MGIRSWPEIERILRQRGESEDEIFSLKSEYFDRVSTELGEDPESDIIKSKRNLFLYGNEKEWELLKAAKSGLIRGFGEVPETGADIIAFGQRFFPGDSENLNAIEENLRGVAEGIREQAGPFQPSSFQERVVAGVSQAPGIATSMLPVSQAVGAAATPALAAAGLGPVAAPIAAGALGFGAYEAIRNARGTPEEMLKGFGKGAALGTVLGAANRLTQGVGKGLGGGLKSEAAGYLAGAGATGVGTGAFELATGAPPEQAAETAAVFGLMSLAHRNKYNKISRALDKAGVTDQKAKDAAYEVSNEIEQQQWAATLKRKKVERAKKRGELVPEEDLVGQPVVSASEVEAETNVPFEQITGAVPWKFRFRRASGEIKSKDDIKLEMWKKIQILNMQKKAAREEPGARTDEFGRERPTEEFSRYWDAKFQGTIRPLQEAHRRAPDDRVGAVYEVLDSTGKNPVYRIQRIDWSKKSPAQWMATSLVDPTAKPRTFRTLAEAEASFQKELNADPQMTAGEVFHRGLSFAQSDNRMLRMFGRSLIAIGAKKMGRQDLADAVSPISADDAMRLSAKELGIPLGQALINSPGRFSIRNNDITMANLKDPETFFHELGHFITKVVYKARTGTPDGKININADTLRTLFTPEELVILEGMGKAEYTPRGKTDPEPIANGNSYEAEGISRYFRGKLYGLDPKSYYTKMFTGSPEGKSIAAKLDSWLQGIDPENPNNSGRIPGFGDKMDRVAKIWDRYRQQNPQQITESFSSNTRGGLLTNPVRELGRAIQQAWTSKTKWIEDMQLKASQFLERKPGEGIPDEQNLAYLQQFNHGSSIGQMGRGWSLTGKMVTPTGIIETKTPQEVISEAGFTAVKGKGNQERLLDEYVLAHNWSRTKRDLMLINESTDLQNSYKAKIKRLKDAGYVNKDGTVDKSKAGEAGFEVPQDPTGMESKTVPGRKILSAGELLGLEGEGTIQNLREKAHHYETEGRKYLEGKEIYDPFEHLRKLDEQYPNANKALSEFELELESALALVNGPIDAGGTGVPWFEKNGAPIYRIDGTREPGPEDFHGLDLQDMLERVKNNRRNFRSEADRIRSNPELDTNIAKYELDSAQMIGGKSIRPTDYWGTSKVSSPIIQWIMRVENTLGSTSFNRYMENVYRLIGVQNKLGLNIGQIPSSSAVMTAIKTGKLSDVEKEMMVGWRFNGRNVYIQFNPNTPEGIRAFNSVKRSNPLFAGNALLDIILGGPKRMMVLGTTGANAGFLVYTNAIRDTMTAAIQSKIPERRGFAGIYRTFHDFVPFLIKANAEILKYGPKEALKRATTPKEKDMLESYLRFIASPVKGAAMIGEDWRSRRSQVSENLMRSKMMSVKNESETQKTLARRQLIAHTIAHPIDMLRTLSTISEDLNRFPEFYMSEKAMINQGKSPIMQPIAAGAEVSIDFKRAGMYSRVINDMVPFFNPTLQGVSKFARTLFNDKEPSLKNLNGKALAFAAQTVTIPSIGLWMIHKDEEWYKELPNWEKLMFWHVKMGNTVFRIPVPFEWGLAMGQLPVMVYDSIYNDAPERVKEQLMIGLRQIVPYGFVDNMPQTIKPAVEAISNKNFFTGIPIESRKMRGLLPQERYTENTLDFYKAVGSATGTSPVMIEHLVRGYFGSVVNGLISDIEATVQLEPKKYTHGMILSRMVSNTDRPGQSVADFYNKLDIADKAWKTAKLRIESGDTGAAAKILNKYKSYLGLDAKSIRDIILTKNTTTPPALLDMHRSYMAIAQARKEKENKAMTEVAQAALGRDWDE